MRHAKSSWKAENQDDHDRGLNKRGKADAPRMGQLLKEECLVPDFMVLSSARRTRKTAEHVAFAAGFRGEGRITGDLYEAGVDELINVLRQISDSFCRVLLIGHNPGLEEFLQKLTGEYTPLPTASLVQLELRLSSWKKLGPKTSAQVIHLWQPRELS